MGGLLGIDERKTMTMVTVYPTIQQLAALKATAKRTGISLSALIREGIDMLLEKRT
jgi:hypothetical protein